jgi:hypothetical protein
MDTYNTDPNQDLYSQAAALGMGELIDVFDLEECQKMTVSISYFKLDQSRPAAKRRFMDLATANRETN